MVKPPPANQRVIEPLTEKDLVEAERQILWFQRNWHWLAVPGAIVLLGMLLNLLPMNAE